MELQYKYYRTYLDFYNKNIGSKLKDIDVFLKSKQSFTKDRVTKLLCITEKNLHSIIKERNITYINQQNFFEIMISGDSQICQFYKREIDCGSPQKYTADDMAYIYEIDKKIIQNIFENMGVTYIYNHDIPHVLSLIKLK